MKRCLPVLEHPSPGEIMQGLTRWSERHPRVLALEIPGRSLEGRPPECCFLTCRYETDAVRAEGFGPDDWEEKTSA